ncbi:MAG: hypothetical protein KatS3mg038_2847 [Candidatus Kapaibacterium sp.]|nr:MAG: hypothetical protein KatS3mg038_2847 [Candidatus Kapabacteria bacterium]
MQEPSSKSTLVHKRFPETVAGILLFVAAASRILPHPPNFAPITAMAVFAGWIAPSYWAALSLVTATMLASDVGLALLHGDWGYLFHGMLPVIYGTFAIIIVISRLVGKRRRSFGAVAAVLVGSSLLFFVVTNFFVWLLGSMYPHTLEGLAMCYAMAVPFYHVNGLAPFELVRNALGGDILYALCLFGAYRVAGGRTWTASAIATPPAKH